MRAAINQSAIVSRVYAGAYGSVTTVTGAMAEAINRALPNVKRGSLSVFGDIFGGRIDNVHTITSAHAGESEKLVIEFDGGETLDVWSPADLKVSTDVFLIGDASKVRWEWFYYGKPRSAENRYFIEHTATDEGVVARSNIDRNTPSFNPSTAKPAIELLSFR